MSFLSRFRYFVLLALAFVLASFHSFTDEWTLKKVGEGVAVYNRDVDTSVVKELRAVTQLKTSLSSIISLLNDRDTYPKWVYRCEKSYMVKRISESEAVYYQNVVAPWPVDNRDFIVDVKVVQDPKTLVVIQTSACRPKFLPEVDGHVRITEFKASWVLTPLKNGIINCEYQLLVNPSGSVPAWMVNLAAIDGPYETTVHLREWVMKEKYQKAVFPFIKEPL